MDGVLRSIRTAQGWYYLLGGLWPFVSWRTFTAVAGPKPDRFQTEVTAALFAASGAALLVTDDRPLAALSAAGCLALDLRHRPRIRPVFLADAVLQGLFLATAIRSGRRPTISVTLRPQGADTGVCA